MTTRRRAIAAIGGGALALAQAWLRPTTASAAGPSGVVLLMYEEPGCPYCAMWHREVGPAYANSPEGRFAPLLQRKKGHPDLKAIKGLNYSPTFILMRGDQEIGRITGYPGADFFWALLGELLAKSGFSGETQVPRH